MKRTRWFDTMNNPVHWPGGLRIYHNAGRQSCGNIEISDLSTSNVNIALPIYANDGVYHWDGDVRTPWYHRNGLNKVLDPGGRTYGTKGGHEI